MTCSPLTHLGNRTLFFAAHLLLWQFLEMKGGQCFEGTRHFVSHKMHENHSHNKSVVERLCFIIVELDGVAIGPHSAPLWLPNPAAHLCPIILIFFALIFRAPAAQQE